MLNNLTTSSPDGSRISTNEDIINLKVYRKNTR